MKNLFLTMSIFGVSIGAMNPFLQMPRLVKSEKNFSDRSWKDLREKEREKREKEMLERIEIIQAPFKKQLNEDLPKYYQFLTKNLVQDHEIIKNKDWNKLTVFTNWAINYLHKQTKSILDLYKDFKPEENWELIWFENLDANKVHYNVRGNYKRYWFGHSIELPILKTINNKNNNFQKI